MAQGDGQEPEAKSDGAEQADATPVPAPENTGEVPVPPAEQRVPDAGTTPPVDPAAAEAPMTDKASQEKADSGPADDTGAAAAAEKPVAAPKAERPARPAKEAEPKGPPRNPPPPGSINEILAQAFGVTPSAAYMVPDMKGESVAVEVARDDITAVMTACRDDERLDLKYMRCLSGIDWQEEGLEVAYHLYSFTKNHKLTVKTRVSYDDATVPSIAEIYPSANWHERETRDMFGINFEGHPDLRPLLLPEDMTDHFPLRKDNPLQEIEEWQGENLVEGAGEDDE